MHRLLAKENGTPFKRTCCLPSMPGPSSLSLVCMARIGSMGHWTYLGQDQTRDKQCRSVGPVSAQSGSRVRRFQAPSSYGLPCPTSVGVDGVGVGEGDVGDGARRVFADAWVGRAYIGDLVSVACGAPAGRCGGVSTVAAVALERRPPAMASVPTVEAWLEQYSRVREDRSLCERGVGSEEVPPGGPRVHHIDEAAPEQIGPGRRRHENVGHELLQLFFLHLGKKFVGCSNVWLLRICRLPAEC